MSTSEAALLRARGVEIQLGGNAYRLRYDFDALEKIEAEFDGIDEFLNDLMGWKKKYRTLRRALVIGLDGQVAPDQLASLLKANPSLTDLYVPVLNAMSEALGVDIEVEAAKLPDADPKAEGSGDSPGAASTGSPLSVMDGRTPSSGL